MPSSRSDIYKLQKSIFDYMKKKALSYECEVSKELISYQIDQKKYSHRKFDISHFNELLESINQSHIVYLGDFHSFDQSSRNLERLMRVISKKDTNFTIGVEVVHIENQFIIDQYLAGHLTELEFLEEINYHESWRFPWFHYKKFFDIAKENNLKILALNSSGNLEERDQKAAEILAKYYKENPQSKILVLFGEYHIMPNKLPLRVEKIIDIKDSSLKQLIIHQNLDEVYWKSIKEDSHVQNQIIKFNEFEFSLQTSAPWIKYESMIYWYENLCDDPEFDIHEYIIESKHVSFNSGVIDNFHYICQKIHHALNLNLSEDDLEDFNLYDHQKLEYVMDRLNEIDKVTLKSFYTRLVKKGRNFRFPYANNYYCSSYSMNRLSFLAGIHIQSLVLKSKDSNYEDVLLDRDQVSKFMYLLNQCMVAYFSSKLINPYRKCDMYQDLSISLNSSKTPEKAKTKLKLSIDLLECRSNDHITLKDLLKGVPLNSLYASAKTVGYLLGDLLYENFYKVNSEDFQGILEILYSPEYKEEQFKKLIKTVLPKETYKDLKKRFF